jgi:hypothetical protein
MLGDCYPAEFFRDIKNNRIRSALSQIADETQEDLDYFQSVLRDFGCEVVRPDLDQNDSILNYIDETGKLNGKQGVPRSPLQPRDTQLIIGNSGLIIHDDHPSIAKTLFDYNPNTHDLRHKDAPPLPEFKYNEIMCPLSGDWPGYTEYKNNYNNQSFFKPHVWKELEEITYNLNHFVGTSAATFMVGSRLYHDTSHMSNIEEQEYVKSFEYFDNFDIFFHAYEGHTDGNFHPIKPGAILSLNDVQTYSKTFPNWDVCYLPDQSWDKVDGFMAMKGKVKGKWWVPEQEDNDEFTYFVETWLNDWVGYTEETVFDVNVLVLDEKHVCVSQKNNTQVNNFLKKHGMEPVYIPWRHRYFWDGGLHCITLDLYREGTQQDYFKG